jgi:hypothetical protein
MSPAVTQLLRSRWLAACVHIALWLLLVLALANLRGKPPAFHERDAFSTPPQSPAPVSGLDSLFAAGIWPKSFADTNALNPFITTYFTPAPAPPPPPPPTTRKIELTYLGFYRSGDSPTQVLVRFADSFIAAPIGARVVSNLFVAQATFQTLTLTNPAAQTNILTVNAKKEIEVPLK